MSDQKKKQQSRLILEELEPRQLFSGGIEGLIDTSLTSSAIATYLDADSEQHKQSTDTAEAEVTAAEQQNHELVFIDNAVDNYQSLIDDLNAQSDSNRLIEVVVLDSQRDGIEQISSTLQQYEDLDAVHILSHGSDGSLQLGNTTLDHDSLDQNRLDIALWANAFAETGDILIYGCNLAETELGKDLIHDLSELTLADVAASDDLTGSNEQGGNWALEYRRGDVESAVVVDGASIAWAGTLDLAQVSAEYVQTPLAFEQNTGQTDAAVDFLTRGDGYSVFLTDGDAVIEITPMAQP